MAELNHREYDALERAIIDQRRVAIERRGTEFIVIPTSIGTVSGREALEATHPTTGEQLTLFLDEIDHIQVVF